jgi:hypothetical protein
MKNTSQLKFVSDIMNTKYGKDWKDKYIYKECRCLRSSFSKNKLYPVYYLYVYGIEYLNKEIPNISGAFKGYEFVSKNGNKFRSYCCE